MCLGNPSEVVCGFSYRPWWEQELAQEEGVCRVGGEQRRVSVRGRAKWFGLVVRQRGHGAKWLGLIAKWRGLIAKWLGLIAKGLSLISVRIIRR